MTNHPNRSNLARSIDELSHMIARTQRDLTAALDGQSLLRRELQLAVMHANGSYMDDGHGQRVAQKFGIDLLLSECETDLLALDLTEIPLAIELAIEDVPMTHAEQQQHLRECEDEHDADMQRSYGRTFP